MATTEREISVSINKANDALHDRRIYLQRSLISIKNIHFLYIFHFVNWKGDLKETLIFNDNADQTFDQMSSCHLVCPTLKMFGDVMYTAHVAECCHPNAKINHF